MTTEMQARLSIVNFNLSFNGWGDGHGYPGKCPNPADTYLGRPCEYSCADGYTFACKHQGYQLPVMQSGLSNGFAYCPSGLQYAQRHSAIVPSWKAQPADAVFIYTGGGAQPGHVEMVEKWEDGVLHTFGWDSGPSNVDHFTGQGGCHRHVWSAPVGAGNQAIMGVMDLAKIVHLPTDAKPTPRPAPPYTFHHPMLMLKTPWMGSPKGWAIIAQVQEHLHARLVPDGIFGPKTQTAVRQFQLPHKLHADGIVGPDTYRALGIN